MNFMAPVLSFRRGNAILTYWHIPQRVCHLRLEGQLSRADNTHGVWLMTAPATVDSQDLSDRLGSASDLKGG